MTRIVIDLPAWLEDSAPPEGADDEARMAWVIGLSERNVSEASGGPFAAAIFGRDGLVAAGVNVVVPSNTAIAHAETTAVAAAGRALGSFDLSIAGPTTLYASTEPCVMCLGATVWSGVSRLVCAATDADARSIGFDEGPKAADWIDQLAARDIAVTQHVLRVEAMAVLEAYAAADGHIYNAGDDDAR